MPNPVITRRLYSTPPAVGFTPIDISQLGSYWKLDEAALSVRADSIGTNNLSEGGVGNIPNTGGIIVNMPNLTGGGLNKWFQCNSNATLQFSPGASKSFACWYFPTTVSIDMTILSKWDEVGNNMEYILHGSTNLSFQVRNLANNANISVTSPYSINNPPNQFVYVACGFDAVNQVIWISINGETKVTTPCTGIRASNAQFRVGAAVDSGGTGTHAIDGFIDEVSMWQRVLTQTELNMLAAVYSLPGMQAAQTVGTDNANRWAAQVVSNGGVSPGTRSKTALANFVDGCVVDLIYPNILEYNIFASDNLTACITNWGTRRQTVIWTNHNFVAGDVSTKGLTGDAATKYLQTGWNPNSHLLHPNQSGFAVYFNFLAGNSTSKYDFGCAGGAPNAFLLIGNYSGLPGAIDTHGNNGGGGIFQQCFYTNSPKSGLFITNRTGNNDHRMFFLDSTHPFAQVGPTEVNAFTSLPSLAVFTHAVNNVDAPSLFTDSTISLVLMFQNFSTANCALLAARIQKLMSDMGRAV